MSDRAGDARLIEAVATCQPEAFDDFYERFSRPLYSLGLRWLRDARDAEELVSDTLIRAWQQADRFDASRGEVASWLFGIARHVAADRWRSGRRHVTERLDQIAEPSHETDFDSLGDAFDVGLALSHLTPIQRQVLVLTYSHDQTEKQISGRLGIPVGTVKSRRFHAMRALSSLLGDRMPAATPAELRGS